MVFRIAGPQGNRKEVVGNAPAPSHTRPQTNVEMALTIVCVTKTFISKELLCHLILSHNANKKHCPLQAMLLVPHAHTHTHTHTRTHIYIHTHELCFECRNRTDVCDGGFSKWAQITEGMKWCRALGKNTRCTWIMIVAEECEKLCKNIQVLKF